MAERRQNDQLSSAETQRRFEAALRGAFNTPPKPMKDIPRRRKPKARQKSRAR